MSNPNYNTIAFQDSLFTSEHSASGFNFTNLLPSPSFPSGYFKNSNAVTIPKVLASGEHLANTTVTMPKEGSYGIWFKPNGWGLVNTVMTGGTFNVIVHRDGVAIPLITWLVINGVGIRIQFNDNVNPNRIIDCTTCTIVDGQYHFASFAWSTATNTLKLYLDGVEVGSSSVTVSLTGSSTTYVSLGCRGGAFSDLEADADLDTYKMTKFFKTDWVDRNNRRAGLNDIIPVQ